MTIATTDDNGRVALGPRFANRMVRIEEMELRVIISGSVPKRERWLHRNLEAKASIERGLAQARTRKFAKNPPDVTKYSTVRLRKSARQR
jgi:hypothetical protein